MPITLGSNIASLRGQRRLNQANNQLSSIYQKLATGQRINKSADDAAGLAIAESLSVDRRIANQAIRNLNDGVSMLNIADSAVQSLSEIVVRLQELAEQASNGVYSITQRKALDGEAQALSKEYTRIVQSTKFNNQSIIERNPNAITLQAGSGSNSVLTANTGGAIGTGEFEEPAGAQYSLRYITSGDFNGDGFLDVAGYNTGNTNLQIVLGNGQGRFGSATTVATGAVADFLTAGDVNGDGILDLIGKGAGTNIQVFTGKADGSFNTAYNVDIGSSSTGIATGDFNEDGILDIASIDDTTSIRVLHGTSNGSFQLSSTLTATSNSNSVVVTGDFDGDGKIDIVAGGGNTEVDFFRNSGSAFSTPATSNFSSKLSSLTSGDFNGDGILDLLGLNETQTWVQLLAGSGNGNFSDAGTKNVSSISSITAGDFTSDGVTDFAANRGLYVGSSVEGTSALIQFSLKGIADARQALSLFKQKSTQLSNQRGQIGSIMTRVGVATNVLNTTRDNFTAAESRIKDADIASESAELTRQSILQQATTAVLSQANLQPSLALKLLS